MILLTGATGTVGYEVLKLSSQKGLNCRAAIHDLNKINKIYPLTSDIVQIDYTQPDLLSSAFKDVRAIFLLTPIGSNMVQMTENVISKAMEHNISYIVKLSSYGVQSKMPSSISLLHRQAEEIIKNSGISYTFLRPVNFMQNLIHQFCDMIQTKKAIFLPCGSGKISFVDVRDIARVAVEVLTSKAYGGQFYNLTGAQALSYYQVAEILSETTGQSITYCNISEEMAYQKLKEMGRSENDIKAAMNSFKTVKEGYRSQVFHSIERITGHKPNSFKQFAMDYKECFV